MVFGSLSGKSSDRDELFLNQISKGFGKSVLSCNMKWRFLFSIYICIDINECLKKITISTFSLAIWFPFVCSRLMQIGFIVLGNPTWCQSPCWGWEVLRGKVMKLWQNICWSRVAVSVLPVLLEENPSLNLLGLLLIFPVSLLPAAQREKLLWVSLRGISTTEPWNGLSRQGL